LLRGALAVCLLIAAIGFARGQSDAPNLDRLTPSGAETRDTEQPKPGPIGQKPEPNQPPAKAPPVLVEVVDAEIDEAEAEKLAKEREEQAANERRLADDTQRLADYTNNLANFTLGLAIVTGVLALIAVGQAILFYVQLRYMRDATKDAGTAAQAALATAESTRVAADAAKVQASALIESERPQLMFLSDDIRLLGLRNAPDSNGSVKLRLKYSLKNHGRTPAWIDTMSMRIITRNALPEVPETATQFDMFRRYIIPPNGGEFFTPEPAEAGGVNIMEIRKLLGSQTNLYMHGIIEYRGIFNLTEGDPYVSGYAFKLIVGDDEAADRFTPEGNAAYWQAS
jgi:hypothetical protein